MIVESIINALVFVITSIFSLLPNLPNDVLGGLFTSINNALNIIFDNLQLIGVFIRPSTITFAVPIALAVHNFKYIYDFTNWIYRKLPFIK